MITANESLNKFTSELNKKVTQVLSYIIVLVALKRVIIVMINKVIFCIFYTKHIVCFQWNFLTEVVPVSTNKIGFDAKIIERYSLNIPLSEAADYKASTLLYIVC